MSKLDDLAASVDATLLDRARIEAAVTNVACSAATDAVITGRIPSVVEIAGEVVAQGLAPEVIAALPLARDISDTMADAHDGNDGAFQLLMLTYRICGFPLSS